MAKSNAASPAAMAYAQAMIELAAESNQADDIGESLSELERIIGQDSFLKGFLADPSIKADERWGVLKRTFEGRSSPIFLNFLGVLAEKGRFNLLPDIVAAYQRMLDEKHNRVRVQITVTRKLEGEELDQVRERVGRALDKSAMIEQKVDDSIIGGIVLQVEDKIIDGSVKSQLQAMRKQLMAAAR